MPSRPASDAATTQRPLVDRLRSHAYDRGNLYRSLTEEAADEIDRLTQALRSISAIPYEAVDGKRAHELSMKALHRG